MGNSEYDGDPPMTMLTSTPKIKKDTFRNTDFELGPSPTIFCKFLHKENNWKDFCNILVVSSRQFKAVFVLNPPSGVYSDELHPPPPPSF